MIFLFDLDGTIVDSAQGIINGLLYAFNKSGDEIPEKGDLKKFIGPPFMDTFTKEFGFSKDKSKYLIELFREYYFEEGQLESEPYEGMKELLEIVSSKYKLAVATSKPEVQAVEILKNHGLDEYFHFIGGATLDNSRIKKHDVIEYVLDNLDVNSRENTFMIGDRYPDIVGASMSGLRSIGVLWGYGTFEELQFHKADYIEESVDGLKDRILSF
ncbi:HAD hydrolase-like protein [Anaerosphaera multitolerans]|uniref:HAD family hydrolase n=1 Tax=Anaerosphaera multitolerans TaxID=2487351 RepID=A0A437S9U7_9FIRM|nr:HAD hydrolase-like protein [Anaerosphaera multitolerans]RVU55587.1 HAD family hydrolase [Anaerosphaera multitolerans]